MAPNVVVARYPKRSRKQPIRYQDEFMETVEDDYNNSEHDGGHFDQNDVTFMSTQHYKKYEYDNVSLSSQDEDDDDIELLSERMYQMNMDGGGSELESKDEILSYESSFISKDADPHTYEEDPDYEISEEESIYETESLEGDEI